MKTKNGSQKELFTGETPDEARERVQREIDRRLEEMRRKVPDVPKSIDVEEDKKPDYKKRQAGDDEEE